MYHTGRKDVQIQAAAEDRGRTGGNATSEQWVVTYRMEPRLVIGNMPNATITEFYRGSQAECTRIAKAFAGGEDDRTRCNPWTIIIGPAECWDELLEDNECELIVG
jgi:hypothetical protein